MKIKIIIKNIWQNVWMKRVWKHKTKPLWIPNYKWNGYIWKINSDFSSSCQANVIGFLSLFIMYPKIFLRIFSLFCCCCQTKLYPNLVGFFLVFCFGSKDIHTHTHVDNKKRKRNSCFFSYKNWLQVASNNPNQNLFNNTWCIATDCRNHTFN